MVIPSWIFQPAMYGYAGVYSNQFSTTSDSSFCHEIPPLAVISWLWGYQGETCFWNILICKIQIKYPSFSSCKGSSHFQCGKKNLPIPDSDVPPGPSGPNLELCMGRPCHPTPSWLWCKRGTSKMQTSRVDCTHCEVWMLFLPSWCLSFFFVGMAKKNVKTCEVMKDCRSAA